MASAGSANKICCGPKEAQQRNGSADAPFGAVAGSLSATLQEVGVPLMEHAEGMSIAGSVKGDSVENPRLFERIGGTVAVDAAVETLYQKILADENLFPLFASLHMDHLKKMQIAPNEQRPKAGRLSVMQMSVSCSLMWLLLCLKMTSMRLVMLCLGEESPTLRLYRLRRKYAEVSACLMNLKKTWEH